MKNFVLVMVLSLISYQAVAITECPLVPRQVWTALDGSNIWICFEKGNCIFKSQGPAMTDKQLDRMYAAALAAISTGKNLLVRYSVTLDCNALDNSHKTDQIDGLWYVK